MLTTFTDGVNAAYSVCGIWYAKANFYAVADGTCFLELEDLQDLVAAVIVDLVGDLAGVRFREGTALCDVESDAGGFVDSSARARLSFS